ncbi:MAG: cytochrome c family protein [Acidimicrobiia bacterium]
MQRLGCAACHGATGQGGVGPSFVGLAGSDVTLSDGSVVIADDPYLLESIRTPGAKRVAGFGIEMPSITLTDDELAEIVAYIRSLEADGG